MSPLFPQPATDAYAEAVGAPIYFASYRLREEMEDLIHLKIALDVLSDKAPTLLTHEIENFHVGLTNFLSSLEKFERRSRDLALEVGFVELDHDKDINRRNEMDSVADASFKMLCRLSADTDRVIAIIEEQEAVAHSLLYLFSQRGEAFREKIEEVAHAVSKDVEIMQKATPKQPVTKENSRSAELINDAETLLDAEHLPYVLDLCRRSMSSPLPARTDASYSI